MFGIMNSKNELAIDRVSGLELVFESKGAAAFFMQFRTGDIELNGKPRVRKSEETE